MANRNQRQGRGRWGDKPTGVADPWKEASHALVEDQWTRRRRGLLTRRWRPFQVVPAKEELLGLENELGWGAASVSFSSLELVSRDVHGLF